MKDLRPRLCIGCLLFLLALAPAMAAKDLSGLQETIDAMSDALTRATLDNDIDTVMSFYADDAVSMPNYHGILEGKPAIREYQENMKAAGISFLSFDFTTMELWKSKSLVYETGTYEVTLAMPGLPKPVTDSGKYMTVYEKQKDGSLKIRREIWNSDLNPWEGLASRQPGLSEEELRQCTVLIEAKNNIDGMVRELKERAYIGLDGEWDEVSSGYRVSGFADGSHAEKAGVRVGDVLIKVNGIALADREGSLADGPNRVPGREAAITVLRDGAETTMNVVLMGATRDIVADTIGEYILDNYIE